MQISLLRKALGKVGDIIKRSRPGLIPVTTVSDDPGALTLAGSKPEQDRQVELWVKVGDGMRE